MMGQMFSVGEISGLQAGQFSTRTLLWSHAVVIAAVCGFVLSCWNTRHLEGSLCCSKTFIYLSEFIVPSKTCKLPIPYALMHPHTIRYAGFWTDRWWHGGRSPSSLALRTRPPRFPTRMQIWTCLSIEHLSTLKQSIWNEPWFTYGFLFAW